MKRDIHPTYHSDALVICACGNTFTTGSTVKEIRVEICSNCHPFYTGKQKVLDTARRIDRFKRMKEKAEASTVKKLKATKTEAKSKSDAKKS